MNPPSHHPASQTFDYPSHSKAAIFQDAGKPFQLIECRVPKLRLGESLLRVECATVCGSDLHSYFGRRRCEANTILGHEVVGTIVAENLEVAGVALEGGGGHSNPFRPALGRRCVIAVPVSGCLEGDFSSQCRFCQRGWTQKCCRGMKYGHHAEGLRSDFLNGSLSQYMILKRGTFIYPVGEEIAGPLVAMSTCATATAMAAIRQSELPAAGYQRSIVIIGAGALGLFVAVSLVVQGYNVLLADTNVQRCELASRVMQRMAADRQVTGGCELLMVGDSLGDQLCQRFPDGVDVVFELSGHRQCVSDAIEHSAIGGTVMLVGTVSPVGEIPLSADFMTRGLRKIIGVHNYVNDDLKSAVDLLQRAHPWLQPVVDSIPRFDLADIQSSFQLAEQERPIRVAIMPNP